jgi:hypothetical protein
VPLPDYTHVFTLGCNCEPSYQLRRALAALKASTIVAKGPFDWCGLTLTTINKVFREGFTDYCAPNRVQLLGPGFNGETWRISGPDGLRSWHQLKRNPEDECISSESWFRFGQWLGKRINSLEYALSKSEHRILFLRLEDPEQPDDRKALAELAELLSGRTKAVFNVTAIAYGQPRLQIHPRVRGVFVDRSWPEDLPISKVDWNRDYGFGTAWHGNSESWDRLWKSI